MSLPRFLLGSFPFAIAAGKLLDEYPRRVRNGLLVLSSVGLIAMLYCTYHGPGLAP